MYLQNNIFLSGMYSKIETSISSDYSNLTILSEVIFNFKFLNESPLCSSF